MYLSMKAQDLFPYSSTLVGLNNIYSTVGSNSFFINSSCILATGKIVSIGKDFILIDSTKDTGTEISNVILVDCFYQEEGIINLIVRDIKSNRVFSIHQCLKCPGSDYTWILVDLNFFIDKMNDKAIRQYCGNCDGAKKKPNPESNHKSTQDDLLEFEF